MFVQSIASGEPVAGVTVDVMAKNGSTLFSQTTDGGGRVHFDKLDGLVRERAPLLLLARKGGDMSFLPLNRGDRQIDYSRFDVGGLQNARSQDQLSAYLFSDRGIYRPGETMHRHDREERRLGAATGRRAAAGRGAGRARSGRQA